MSPRDLRARLAATLAGAAISLAAPLAAAQSATSPYTLARYVDAVLAENTALAARRFDATKAEADVTRARVLPDPQLNVGVLQYDVTRKGNPTGTLVQLAVPLVVGGQRGARIAVAEAEVAATGASLADTRRQLRAAAADAFIDALHARLVRARKGRTSASLERLVAVNGERARVGDVGEATVLQSKVEASRFRAGELAAEGEVKVRDAALRALLAPAANAPGGPELLAIEGDLAPAAERHFSLAALAGEAVTQRADVREAVARRRVADRGLALAQAERVIDVTVAGTWQHNLKVTTPLSVPASDFVGGSVTVPLPFSRRYTGDLQRAEANVGQAAATVTATTTAALSELRAAIAAHDAAAARVRLFTGGVLADADKVLEKTLFNYQRGGATLVEVLVAQRTVDEVYIDFYDALAEAAHAAVAVQRAAGGDGPPF